MKANLVAGGQRNFILALFTVLALTLAASSALGDSISVVTPPNNEIPPYPLVQPPDTTGVQPPADSGSTNTISPTLLDLLLIVIQVI